MANIGSFEKVNAEFQGEIVTLSVQARNVRIVPESSRTNDNAPSHRVFVGRAEIGAAWPKGATPAGSSGRSGLLRLRHEPDYVLRDELFA
jgi:uncharacterized protein (DUF736 family)